MIRLRVLTVLVILSAGAATAQSVYTPGQRPSPAAQTGDITLTGQVVNSVSGEGIARALVEMGGMQGRSTLTDSSGKFQFDNLPEMQAVLVPRKPGYFTEQELARGYRMKPISITSGMGAITVKLIPAGVVTGHITTSDGDPVEGANVRLKSRMIEQGRMQWIELGGSQSDEDGAFRISSLRPGTYYVYSDGMVRPTGPEAELFAPVFYPGVPDMSGAAAIQVQPGQTVNADLTLQPEKAYRVTGTVTGLAPGNSAVIAVIGSSQEPLPLSARVLPDGSFEVPRIAAGTYTLKAFSQPGMRFMPGMASGFGGGGRPMMRNPQNYTGKIQITVSTDLSGITIPLQPSATIPVNVRTDFSNSQTTTSGAVVSFGESQRAVRQFVQLTLQGSGSGNNYGAEVDPNGAITLRDVEPGHYRVQFNSMGRNVYVQSATFGNTDLLHDDLVISSGGDQQPIDVVLRDDAASISGTANCGDSQCWVLVIPDSTTAIPARQLYVSNAGTFQAGGLPPGSYHVYAFDRVDGVEYTNPDAMKEYDGSAQSVTLSAGQSSQVSVELTKVAGQ